MIAQDWLHHHVHVHVVYAFLLVVFVGNGVVIHIPQFFEELQALDAKGSQKCPLPYLFHNQKSLKSVI